jgi:hypothetical protein
MKDGSEDGAVNFLISSVGWAESFWGSETTCGAYKPVLEVELSLLTSGLSYGLIRTSRTPTILT